MRPQGVTEKQVKLRAFPFSLGDKAKDWLYSLPSGFIVSWKELKKQFLENYFPASRTTNIRKEISGKHQFPGESSMSIGEGSSRGIQQVKACGICTSSSHFIDACPTFHEELTEHADTVGGFSGQQHRKYDPFSNTYNPKWKPLNLRYNNQPQNFQKPHTNNNHHLLNLTPIQAWARTTKQNRKFNCAGHAQKGKTEEELDISSKQAQVIGDIPNVLVTIPPFPKRFPKAKKGQEEREIFETFCKVEVKYRGECVRNSTTKTTPKCKDPVGPLNDTGVVIQLADRSIVYSEGVLEDVLVQVNELVFLADFFCDRYEGG
ncbi:hypothetical protein Sango_1557400 [Sesamum angolense]|uniref:Retrotransposon gag domain-containing protein n=1 Tax=Sesamum angolense TaxID=2727404 RepID=A0AAE1WP82_9LAMI|nr:hypothetical protein Sango_1557400 [Sesamum angolense]